MTYYSDRLLALGFAAMGLGAAVPIYQRMARAGLSPSAAAVIAGLSAIAIILAFLVALALIAIPVKLLLSRKRPRSFRWAYSRVRLFFVLALSVSGLALMVWDIVIGPIIRLLS